MRLNQLYPHRLKLRARFPNRAALPPSTNEDFLSAAIFAIFHRSFRMGVIGFSVRRTVPFGQVDTPRIDLE
jgi:hypothetical protein